MQLLRRPPHVCDFRERATGMAYTQSVESSCQNLRQPVFGDRNEFCRLSRSEFPNTQFLIARFVEQLFVTRDLMFGLGPSPERHLAPVTSSIARHPRASRAAASSRIRQRCDGVIGGCSHSGEVGAPGRARTCGHRLRRRARQAPVPLLRGESHVSRTNSSANRGPRVHDSLSGVPQTLRSSVRSIVLIPKPATFTIRTMTRLTETDRVRFERTRVSGDVETRRVRRPWCEHVTTRCGTRWS